MKKRKFTPFIDTKYIDTRLAKIGAVFLLLAALLALAGCLSSPADLPEDVVAPTEEQQILNVVEDFYVRDEGNVPEYEAAIEAIDGNWVRVSIAPVGVETINGPDILYLQNQAEAERALPTLTTVVSPTTNTARVATSSGWAIVAGPQAQFTEAELSAAGVPASIRP